MLDFVFEHPQLLILIIGGLVFLFNKYQELKQKQEIDRELDEIDRRERESAPDMDFDPPGYPRDEYAPPPLPSAPPPLPPETASAVELQRQQQIKTRLREAREARAARPVGRAAAAKARLAGAAGPPSSPVSPAPLRSRLRNRSELRRAVLLREILGPPAGLR